MSAPHTVTTLGEFMQEVLVALGKHDLALTPKTLEARRVVDALDEEAWRLVIVLPRPDGETWDAEQVFNLRRTAAGVFDEIAADHGLTLPGTTLAVITTDEATPDEIGVDAPPQPGEDPAEDARQDEA